MLLLCAFQSKSGLSLSSAGIDDDCGLVGYLLLSSLSSSMASWISSTGFEALCSYSDWSEDSSKERICTACGTELSWFACWSTSTGLSSSTPMLNWDSTASSSSAASSSSCYLSCSSYCYMCMVSFFVVRRRRFLACIEWAWESTSASVNRGFCIVSLPRKSLSFAAMPKMRSATSSGSPSF